MMQSVAFLGLGSMGEPMARNILNGGYSLFVYNRSPNKREGLLQAGAKPINHPSEAFQNGKIAITMVSNDQALEELCGELLKGAKEGSIHVSMSTVSPKTTEKLQKMHAAKGVFFVAAPVFGRPDVAKAGKLWICAAGPSQAKKEVEPILRLMGQRVEDFGEEPKNSNVVKLCGNFLILSAAESLGEIAHLAENNGVDKRALVNFFAETLFPTPVYKTYGNLVVDQAFEPAGFKLSLGLKDLKLVNQVADDSSVKMPVAKVLLQLLEQGMEAGRENMDWSAVTLSS